MMQEQDRAGRDLVGGQDYLSPAEGETLRRISALSPGSNICLEATPGLLKASPTDLSSKWHRFFEVCQEAGIEIVPLEDQRLWAGYFDLSERKRGLELMMGYLSGREGYRVKTTNLSGTEGGKRVDITDQGGALVSFRVGPQDDEGKIIDYLSREAFAAEAKMEMLCYRMGVEANRKVRKHHPALVVRSIGEQQRYPFSLSLFSYGNEDIPSVYYCGETPIYFDGKPCPAVIGTPEESLGFLGNLPQSYINSLPRGGYPGIELLRRRLCFIAGQNFRSNHQPDALGYWYYGKQPCWGAFELHETGRKVVDGRGGVPVAVEARGEIDDFCGRAKAVWVIGEDRGSLLLRKEYYPGQSLGSVIKGGIYYEGKATNEGCIKGRFSGESANADSGHFKIYFGRTRFPLVRNPIREVCWHKESPCAEAIASVLTDPSF